MLNKFLISTTALAVSFSSFLYSQQPQSLKTTDLSGANNPVSTAVPFLTIAPDARAAGMGDAGVATSPDANSNHWNASKLAFADKPSSMAICYTPWLKGLVNDIYLAYVSGYVKIDKKQAVGASLRYFSLGEINFTDATGGSLGNYTPNEFAVDVSYARVLNPNFSGGIALRYIRSNLTQGISTSGTNTNAGNAVSADISGYYFNDVTFWGRKTHLSAGFNISNMGSKIAYSQAGKADFLPINLRLGGVARINLDDYNTLAFVLDINKLLVPTPPVYDTSKNAGANPKIIAGQDPNRGVVAGMLGSFTDAPGGFQEELHEIIYCPGLEYWYDNQFAVRTGYFYEHPTKGGRQYYTIGLGVRYNVFGLDVSYLIPATSTVKSPLENTLRFSLLFNFDYKDNKTKESSN